MWETGLSVEIGSVETLDQSIIRIINDECVRFRLWKNALGYADEFSWDKSAQEFLEVLVCVWQSDENVKLSRFYLTLNMFGTFAILRLFDLGDGYE